MKAFVHHDRYVYQWSVEFELLDEYLSYIEGSIDITLQDITKILRAKEEYFERDDGNPAYYFDGLVLPDSSGMILKRFIYNNYFLSLWATYESGLNELSIFLAEAKITRRFKQKRDEGFVDGILKYFKNEHNIDIPLPEPLSFKSLNYLSRLRNIIAHGNGRTRDISKKDFSALIKWIEEQPEINVSEDGWILLNSKFCRQLYEDLHSSFNKLCRLSYDSAPDCDPRPCREYIVHF